MPLSAFSIIPDISFELIIKNPKTVLDCGIGNGLYGAVIQNYLPNCKVTGIEGWEKYNNNLWACYDAVYIGTMPEVLSEVKTFDMILILDVIEHFEKEEGKEVVRILQSKLNRKGILLISTPDIFCEQGAVGGNELEIHRSLWKIEDLPGFETKKSKGPDKYGHYMQLYKYINP